MVFKKKSNIGLRIAFRTPKYRSPITINKPYGSILSMIAETEEGTILIALYCHLKVGLGVN